MSATMSTFSISYDEAFIRLSNFFGIGPANSHVQVDDEYIRIRMGWTFQACIPRDAIRSVEQPVKIPHQFGLGARWRGGTWAVNGSYEGGVRLSIQPAAKARVMMFVPVKVGDLYLSLDEPEAFVAALARR